MKETKNTLISGIFVISIFMLIYIPTEYYIVETRMLTDKLNPMVGSVLLIILVLLINTVRWSELFRFKYIKAIILIAAVSSLFVSGYYRSKTRMLENDPKVYSVVGEGGIQGQVVKIKGKNFYPAWKKGHVYVGNQEMTVKSWDENVVIAEMQVPTDFGWFGLYIQRSDGTKSNKLPFEIKNPASLY